MSAAESGNLPPYTGTLAPEHLAFIHRERDRWRRIGLSTIPADRPAAGAAVRRVYAAAGFPPPGVVVWMDSPLGGYVACATILMLADQLQVSPGGRPRRRFWGQFGTSFLDQLRRRLGDRLERTLHDERADQLWRQLWEELADQRVDQLWGQVRQPLWWQLAEQRWDQLWDRFGTRICDQLGSRLDGTLRNNLAGEFGRSCWEGLWDQIEGEVDPWGQPLAFDHCLVRIAGLPPSPLLEALAAAVESLGWWWPLRGAAVLTDRPAVIATDENGSLHDDRGPALAWADGSTVHAVHGVGVPAHVVEAPHTIIVDQIRDEPNVEVRRVMLERYGHARYLRDAGAERVHADDTGTLWRCRLPDDEDLVMVQVTNATPEPDGSARTYWLRVPPDMHTARQAVAWTFNLDEHDYRPTAQT